MSPAARSRGARNFQGPALRFFALGDDTRLSLVHRLSRESRLSITELTEGSDITRQAITKHLRVLEDAGLVHAAREGRETLYEMDAQSVEQARADLERISKQWDAALLRLKNHVER